MTTFTQIAPLLEGQAIEVPSWAFGNSGTRFKVFGTPGTPRTVEEKVADAAAVHRFTGLAPSVALHIPWDLVDDFGALRRYAEDLGIRLGTINSNTFQDDDYKLGALTHTEPKIRQKAIDHHFECIEVMHRTGSRDLKIWLAEGSNYPGQADMRGRQDRLAESLRTIYDRLDDDQRLVLEYKLFEPAFYHTDVPDWGTSYAHVAALGDRAVRVPRHRASRARHEHRVHRRPAAAAREARLVRLQQPLLCRRRPDRRRGRPLPAVPDHLRGDPRRRVRARQSDVAFMLDQCHNIERKIPGQIRSVLNVQEMTARALLVDRDALAAAQEAGDVLGANEVFMDAFYTDVRADLAEWRAGRGLPAAPMQAYRESGYQEQIETDRVGGTQAGWN